MLPFKRILCPTDFSEPACSAIKAAVEMAKSFSAELILLHVVGPIPALDTPAGVSAFDVSGYQRELAESAEASLQRRIDDHVPDTIESKAMVVNGDAAHEIARVAKEENVDLVVLSTHGESGWRHRIFGSVPGKVIRQVACPVLTIHLE